MNETLSLSHLGLSLLAGSLTTLSPCVFPVLPLGGTKARFQPVYVGDVAAVFADALECQASVGQIYELCGPKVYSLRQLVEYAELIGLPIGELFLEDALEEPWPEFRSKADPIRVENLTRLLGGLGVGLRDDVFGVIRHLQARVTFSQGNRPIGALMALAAAHSENTGAGITRHQIGRH